VSAGDDRAAEVAAAEVAAADVAAAVVAAAELRDARLSRDQRRRRGVVHTPPELARFMARRVDAALQELGLAGLGDRRVSLLDPACGPGVFLAAALSEATGPGPGEVLGLDVDAGALELAREILDPAFARRGWPLSLRRADTLSAPPPIDPARVPVVLGNPPWAGRTANREAAYTEGLLDDFRREPDGGPLRERKIGVLSDDYVRFFRWAAEAVRARPRGVVALVTNASFLDGPVHRGMRAALLRWFDAIEVIDLGGSALLAKAGERDGNVFGVRVGAAITVAVRGVASRAVSAATVSSAAVSSVAVSYSAVSSAAVSYSAVRGDAEAKLAALDAGAPAPTPLRAAPPLHRFVPGPPADPRYDAWPALPALMPFHREGVQTNRDAFCVDADPEALRARLRAFAEGAPGPFPGKADVASRHYDPDRARAAVRDALAADPDGILRRVAYRPLDVRWIAPISTVCHRPRPPLRAAMAHSPLALLTVRKDRGQRPWRHAAATRHLVDNCFLSSRSSCRTRAFPSHRPDGEPNLDAAALAAWTPALEWSPEDLIRYALCVLASSAYRTRWDGQLRADHPRLPPPPDASVRDACVAAGARLAEALDAGPDGSVVEVEIGHHRAPGAGRVAEALAGCDAMTQGWLGD